MNIHKLIASWDGKSTDELGEIYCNYNMQSDFIKEIVGLIEEVSYQKGAIWLLKKWLESDNQLEDRFIRSIYGSLPVLDCRESKLHILQCIPYMPIKPECKGAVESFLRVTLTSSNKFVRAWSYNGFYELALQYPEYVEETKQFFELALRDEAASVKARIRNIMKKGF